MREQHPKVAIAAFADAPQAAVATGGVFFGCEAEPGCKVPRIFEVTDRTAGRGGRGRGGHEPDAGDREQLLAGRGLRGSSRACH